MKLNTSGFCTKCQHPLLLGAGLLPVVWIVLCNFRPQALLPGSLMIGLAVLLSWCCMLLPGKIRMAGALVGAAALIGAGMALLPPSQGILLLLIPTACVALLAIALPMAGWPGDQELHTGWYVAAISAHVLMQLLVFGAEKMNEATYAGIQSPLLVSFLICAVLTLLAMNRGSLLSASQNRCNVPVHIRRQNLIVTLALLALGVVIAAIPAIGQALNTLWGWIKQIALWLVHLLMMLLPEGTQSTGGGGGGSGGPMALGEAVPPSAFALVMEKVIAVVALISLAAALALAARILGKRIWQLLRLIWRKMSRYGASISEDYEDEITDTREEGDVERTSLFSRLRRFVPEDERGLNPTEQVRSRYRRMKRRHDDWSRANTARETLPNAAAALYEQARYSGKPLSAEEAERFRQDTKKL